jgi:hypothetical protein
MTLLAVGDASDLAPLATTLLARLTSLTVRVWGAPSSSCFLKLCSERLDECYDGKFFCFVFSFRFLTQMLHRLLQQSGFKKGFED